MKQLLDEELEFWGLSMNKFERWFLKRLLAKQVRQGYSHDLRIMRLYTMIREACDVEFTEDNCMTRDAHLRELFEHTQGASEMRTRMNTLPNIRASPASSG